MILVKPGFIVANFTRIHLTEKRHHFGVQHRSEKVRMESRMSKALLELMTLVVGAFRMNLSLTKLFFVGREILKQWKEGAVDVDLVNQDDENGRDCRYPLEGAESVLEADCCKKIVSWKISSLQKLAILRIINNCMRTTQVSKRLITTFQIRCHNLNTLTQKDSNETRTPPLSTLEMKTYMS